MKLFKLEGVVQPYAWGGATFIPDLIGMPASNGPCAEYWMGAHEKAPSKMIASEQMLNSFVASNPDETLGKRVNATFGKLPFLFKVLDVKDMLSIQVHPSKKEAEIGFQRENELRIPLSASNRNYKDDNHKPEIMVALGDFWLLHGFKAAPELKNTLGSTPELKRLLPIFEKSGYQGLYQSVMEEDANLTKQTLRPLIDRILPRYQAGDLDKETPEFWSARAYETFCKDGFIDKGIYSIFFFNIVHLVKGEGIFQDAGVPHAYMEGQNMELMANSDNVLRGGLTPKHIDVPELLKHTKFEATIPNILQGEGAPEMVFKSSAKDFELSKISLADKTNYKVTSETLEIMIVMTGSVEVISDEVTICLSRGEVLGVSANCSYEIRSSNTALLFKAKAGR